MGAKKSSKKSRKGFIRQHGLSIAVAGILLVWLVLYRQSDPDTHLGGFFGNAVADWLGTLVIVVATKYCTKSAPPRVARRTPPRAERWLAFSSTTR